MIFAGVALALACWLLTVMLDMADPWLNSVPVYTPGTGFSLLPWCDQIDAWGLIWGHKKASRVAPARPSTHPVGTNQGCTELRKPASARYRPHGSHRWT